MKIHRVGTLTFGVTLISIGILFLIQIFCDNLPVKMIIKAWPIVFIFLGVEILYANRKTKEKEFLYDKTAIILTMILLFFAMLLAIIENAVRFSI